jgi:hypothetical protein
MTYRNLNEQLRTREGERRAFKVYLVLATLAALVLLALVQYARAETIEPAPPIVDPTTPESQAKLEVARLANCREMYAECAREVANLQNEINAIHYVRGEAAEEFIGMRACLSDYDTACLRTFEESGTCFIYLGACGYTRMAATQQAITVRNAE